MANANDPSTWPELERVQVHSFPDGCGCQFLIGWQETRIRTESEPTGQVQIKGKERIALMGPEKLHDVIEIHTAMVEAGLREDFPPEPIVRLITHDEAEEIVSAKRNHEWWDGHVVPNGEQPYPRMCAKHGKLPYNDDTYALVCEEENLRVANETEIDAITRLEQIVIAKINLDQEIKILKEQLGVE